MQKARKQADDEYKKIVSNARTTARKIEADATADAARSKERILADAEQEIVDMIALATEKNMGDGGSARVDHALYDEFLSKVEETK